MERRATADFEGSYQSASRQGNSACRRCQSLRADGELLERPCSGPGNARSYKASEVTQTPHVCPPSEQCQPCTLQSTGMRAPTFGVTMTVGSLLPTVWHARRHASSQVGAAVAPTIEAASALFGPQKMIRL